jgi:hypothetical protein
MAPEAEAVVPTLHKEDLKRFQWMYFQFTMRRPQHLRGGNIGGGGVLDPPTSLERICGDPRVAE